MNFQTDEQIEKLAQVAVEAIQTNTKLQTMFILRKKMNAAEMAEKITGVKILDTENVPYFWNAVGGRLAYVKVNTLTY